ncbi:hypothetical protein INR49_032044 [Caranx melampygus]|nr:hypothetical protein INR49_032044 [Caranx melampygus]
MEVLQESLSSLGGNKFLQRKKKMDVRSFNSLLIELTSIIYFPPCSTFCTSVPWSKEPWVKGPGWLGMGPSNYVKPIGNISLEESTGVLFTAVNWGMKAHQQAAVLQPDQ